MRKNGMAVILTGILLFTQAFGMGVPLQAENAQEEAISQTSENAIWVNDILGNHVSGNDIWMNNISENSIWTSNVSENSVLTNDISGNSVSNNTVSENGLSQNQKTKADFYAREKGTDEADASDVSDVSSLSEDEEKEPLNLDGISIASVSMKSYKSVQITWSAIKDAAGYEIYRSGMKYIGYECIKDISSDKLVYIDKTKNLTVGKKYYYKVRAYGYEDGQKVYGEFSKTKKITYSLPETTLTSAKPVSGGLKLKWKKVLGADGYVIYRSETENGKYQKVREVTYASAKNCTLTESEANGEYYYKIRAYRLQGKKKVYGAYSNAKKASVSAFAYSGESYQKKCMRVFGVGYMKRFTSALEAQKYMTTITVKVWDFDSNGNKVTKTKTIQIHKNLAATVQQIFKEIYEGKEKFPIKVVGGYNWRGNTSTSEHNLGTALDINPNENYMIEGNGTISSGAYWKPGTDPYSIPANGEVVKIFEKYGFRWGGLGWSSGRKDYMHFSYFGT